MSDDTLNRLVIRELEEIGALLEKATPLLDIPVDTEPAFERLAALSTILTSFYTGIERIFGVCKLVCVTGNQSLCYAFQAKGFY